MELEHLDTVTVSGGLCEEYFFIVTTYKMAPDHGLRLADDVERLFVQAGLGDAVVELDDQHVLLNTLKALGHELHGLDFVFAKAP